ncbi:M20 family metallo-hydrolase [Corynebacterium sp. SCR221107]|uniref:M20 family metallo-hydrolase n=1 Tax=Corynebacterium sp. SCR221107 TaxID=3017361 RepID=UPI0022EC7DFE|nr:M20 family metallo-hydrolase [Corynebacterium sp. SCR221107]WBT08721.1 M20 family metallo-hydrolase [Corynebacterium sp. SCR221107]
MTYPTSDQQFLSDFQTMSSHGATAGGGVERQAASAGDIDNRAWFSTVLQSMGARVIYDEIGTQYGLFEFIEDAPFVGLGSHLDSQPLAGRYDGAYGVLAAAHAAARIKCNIEAGLIKPRFNLAVINWFNEEGSRFVPSMMGSGVFTGVLSLDEALRSHDLEGVSVDKALAAAGWGPIEKQPQVVSYAEIHVEQGKELEIAGNTIGLVTATWGAKKFEAIVHGEQGHTGSTLMADRHDALFSAAVIIAEVQRLTKEFEVGKLQASVSQLTLLPNSPVTIAREVRFNIDLRSPDSDILAKAQARLDEIIHAAEEESRTTVELVTTHEWDLNPYPLDGVELARSVVTDLGYPFQEILTVAGHDSTNMKEHVPTVMLFIPSVDGISHNEAEFTKDEDCLAGVDVLTQVGARLVEGALA